MLRTILGFSVMLGVVALLGTPVEAQDAKKDRKKTSPGETIVRGSMGKIHVEKGRVTQITLIIPQLSGKFQQKIEEVKIGPDTQFIYMEGKEEKSTFDAKTVLTDAGAKAKFKDDTMAQIKIVAGKQAEWVKFTGKQFGQK